MSEAPDIPRPIRIGISSCLLGEAVRFDGGHKRDPFLTETFGRFVEWVPICPEVECGLGTPRASMRLVRVKDQVRLLTVKTAVDLTDRMIDYSERRVARLPAEDLSGYVLKKDSPSCGLDRVKIYELVVFRPNPGEESLRPASSSAFPICRSKKKAACRIPGSATTSSSPYLPTGGFAASSTANRIWVRLCVFTPHTSWS